MPTPTLQVESFGSFLFFCESEKLYLRSPKGEGPRLPGPNGEDWGGPDADPGLRDLQWHSYRYWRVHEGTLGPHRLIIGLVEDPDRCTSFPIDGQEFDRLRELVDGQCEA